MAIQISGTNVIDNSRNIVNLGFMHVGSFTTTQRDALTGITAGTMIWNSTNGAIEVYTGSGWDY